jgi:uncharacterized protein (DUF2235 family)
MYVEQVRRSIWFKPEDKIFLFGFSRGAYTVRAVVKQYSALANDFKVTLTRTNCQPWFLGVWDTVSSVGWVENPLKLPFAANSPDIHMGRHAVSIDERQSFFRNHLWRRPGNPDAPWGPQNVKQVWFPGVHCDVGGGYPEAESGPSKIALKWMLEEAKAEGLVHQAPGYGVEAIRTGFRRMRLVWGRVNRDDRQNELCRGVHSPGHC